MRYDKFDLADLSGKITLNRMITIQIAYIITGTIEVNNHLTLYDLRMMIKHELDRKLVPRSYRFLYKNVLCSMRQESFRKVFIDVYVHIYIYIYIYL
jgi:hypothetical protein